MVHTRKEGDEFDHIKEWLLNLHRERFFGIIEFHFQRGEIVRAKKQETYEPKDFVAFRRALD